MSSLGTRSPFLGRASLICHLYRGESTPDIPQDLSYELFIHNLTLNRQDHRFAHQNRCLPSDRVAAKAHHQRSSTKASSTTSDVQESQNSTWTLPLTLRLWECCSRKPGQTNHLRGAIESIFVISNHHRTTIMSCVCCRGLRQVTTKMR